MKTVFSCLTSTSILSVLSATAAGTGGGVGDSITLTPNATQAKLPYYYQNDIGPFEMSWGFEGIENSIDEIIIIEYTLPSDIYSGIGLDCTSSAKCDMIVGNGGGTGGVFLEDYYEIHGDRKPKSDTELDGTSDVILLAASYKNYYSTIRFSRKLNTKDRWDSKLSKGPTDMVYAWCEVPFCYDTDSPHAPGAWNIINVDLSGKDNIRNDHVHDSDHHHIMNDNENIVMYDDICYAGSEALCGCSELIKKGVIQSFDDCTQQAAVDYCKTYGAC